ncbi:hypothetical protein [Teredinibacter sp. KSP-S5-2]|uniref:hypothetical protein n=1 Tax=Teredinibacter sp. KSP-S5-2 TaxID=3034506 RepID=UPI0029342771|nr:hypothetical protein [Teredinibacter sp. KSP-S5-2]WNO09412.1 hypothetical protein P5V12_20945 [Teredinibacter sp. KSP-S5-2]
MIKKNITNAAIFLLCSAFCFNPAWSSTVTDTFIGSVLDSKLPTVLHEELGRKWQYGTYDLTILKRGAPQINSGSVSLNGRLPVKVKLRGKIQQDLALVKVELNCQSEFDTTGSILLTPQTTADGYVASVDLEFPIPDALLNCEGVQLNIAQELRKIVQKEKPKVERDLEKDINQFLRELGV